MCMLVCVLEVVWFSNRLLYKKIHFISVCVCVNWVKKRDTLGKCLYVVFLGIIVVILVAVVVVVVVLKLFSLLS